MCVSLLFAAPTAAQSAGAPAACGPTARQRSIRAGRITGSAPAIDGRLDEPIWSTAPVTSGFVQQRPDPYAPGTDSTQVSVLYDEHALYVGMRMFRRDRSRIAATVARRDYSGYSDWAQVMIDSYHDKRTAWRFAVNPSGVQKDALEFNDGQGEDLSWDAIWDASAHIDSLGWTAEFRIPLSQLRFSTSHAGSDGLVWGIDFLRDDASRNERDYWAPLPPDGSAMVSCFGTLTGLSGVASPQRLEILPYVLGGDTRAPGNAADPFYSRNDWSTKAGADIKYGLTSNLTLTAALNPDFGQVEADPSVINLTAFETFFPEKRPLFLEGEELFDFNIAFGLFLPNGGQQAQPFYSRRIGREPQGTAPDSAVFSDSPSSTTILGAAKLSGKTASGWSIGLLDAVTRRENATYTDAAGQTLESPVEPLTNYAVARAIKDFRRGQSAVGMIVTAADRDITNPALDVLRSGAYTFGVDGRHRFGDGKYELTASALGTWLRGSTAAISAVQLAPGHWYQRPDASYLHFDSSRTSLGGGAASAAIARIAGNWHWSIDAHVRSPGFEMNDLGFQQTADWIIGGAELAYLRFKPGRVVRDWNVSATGSSGWTFGGERRSTGVALSGGVDFVNNWGLFAQIGQSLSALSIDALRGGPALRVPANTSGFLFVNTDQRRRTYGTTEIDFSTEPGTGGRSLTISPLINVRPSGRTELSLGPSLSWSRNPWQYVTQLPAFGAAHYVFSRIDQRVAALTVRASYSFTPTLSFQFYGEPFIGAGSYSSFKQVSDPRAAAFSSRFHTFTPGEISYVDSTRSYQVDLNGDAEPDLGFGNPDFNVKQFRSTAVLRWEYRHGSTLYAVWSQDRSAFDPTGRFSLGADTRALFTAPARNVLLVKMNYWLNW